MANVRTPPERPRMARKQAPDPTSQAYHAKLGRLLERKRRGRTDSEIAEAAGMSRAAFARLLTGGVPDPRMSTVERVLKALGATFCDFDRA